MATKKRVVKMSEIQDDMKGKIQIKSKYLTKIRN